jgi:hypothetical protein
VTITCSIILLAQRSGAPARVKTECHVYSVDCSIILARMKEPGKVIKVIKAFEKLEGAIIDEQQYNMLEKRRPCPGSVG